MAQKELRSASPVWPPFARLWGIALVAHVVGNWAQPDIPEPIGWANLAVGLTGVILAVRPNRAVLIGASSLVVVSVLLEMPVTGNHWVVAGLISMAILAAGGRPELFMTPARLVLLIFYGFAAFAKLNSGFFDPTASCAVFYANQWLNGLGIDPVPTGSAAAVIAIWGSVLVELSVPVMLVWRRTRVAGVIVGSLFHTVISFDLNQHFYDFTAVLLPLFLLFAPPDMVRKADLAWNAVSGWARRLVTIGFGLLAGVMVVAAVSPIRSATPGLVTAAPFALWVPFAVWWSIVLVRSTAPGEPITWTMRPVALLVVVATFLNGLTPYLELKTAYSFNMYANLLTAGGESNHFLIQRTVPLREGYESPVEILDTSDEALLGYRDLGYLIAYPEFRRYLAGRPEASVEYRRGGVVYQVRRVANNLALSAPVPFWWRLFPLRAVDTLRPPRCQDVFLPAL